MERRDWFSFPSDLSRWRRSAFAGTAALDGTDSRWAFVSTSVTFFVAGSIAWLAAGTAPPSAPHWYRAASERSLLPYQLFTRLASEGNTGGASYAAIGPSATLAVSPLVSKSPSAAALDQAAADDQTDQPGTSDNNARTITMDSGDTLTGVLTDAGISNDDANAVVAALRKVYDPRSIRAGQSFDLSFGPAAQRPVARIVYSAPTDGTADDADAAQASAGPLLSVSFSPSIEQEIAITRATDGSFTAQSTKHDLVARYHRAGARIDSSLYLAAMQAGIPADIVVQMIHVLSYQVDFQRDIRPGNSFELLYNYYYTPDGKPAKQGVIDYITMNLGGRTVTLYRYDGKNGDGVDYLDARGRSAKSLLMRTPVDGARISSGFGMRFHPVLGYTRMHKGVDFAVPVGTPVMAAGAGTIKFEGRENGYGNFLLIQNNSQYSTAYGHLSRFVRGLHVGSHVHQGEVVAYSGNTGITTGPHLHYEIRIDGKQVNPLNVKIATGVQLRGKPLQTFLMQRLHVDQQLAAMPLETKVAENSAAGLRTGKD